MGKGKSKVKPQQKGGMKDVFAPVPSKKKGKKGGKKK